MVARRFINNVVCLFGVPSKLTTDRGPAFAAQLWREVMTALGVQRNVSTARHPQTDGQSEAANRHIVQYLRHFVSLQQHDQWTVAGNM